MGISTTLAAVCNILICVLFINTIGLYAASLATLVSYLFLFVFRMYHVRKFAWLKYKYSHIFTVMLVLTVESLLCAVRKPITDILNIIIGVVAFLALNRSLVDLGKNKILRIIEKPKAK